MTTRKCGNCDALQRGRRMLRLLFSALTEMLGLVSSWSTYTLLYYSIFAANTLH